MDTRVERSKAKIKQALIKCMLNQSFHDIKVKDIVAKSGCNRGTFYNHFDSKETLLFEIIEGTLEEMKRQIRVPYKQLSHIDFNRFPKQDISLFNYLHENSDLFQALIKEAAHFDMHRIIADTIEEIFIEEYDFELNNANTDTKWYYVYCSNGIAAVIMRWIETGYIEPAEQVANQAIELMKTYAIGFKQNDFIY